MNKNFEVLRLLKQAVSFLESTLPNSEEKKQYHLWHWLGLPDDEHRYRPIYAVVVNPEGRGETVESYSKAEAVWEQELDSLYHAVDLYLQLPVLPLDFPLELHTTEILYPWLADLTCRPEKELEAYFLEHENPYLEKEKGVIQRLIFLKNLLPGFSIKYG